jgi:hypothetical protein
MNMSRLKWVWFVSLLAIPVAALAFVGGCSSSSAAPTSEAGTPESGATADGPGESASPDGGTPSDDAGVSLTWGAIFARVPGPAADGDGGGDADTEAAAPANPYDGGVYNGMDGGGTAVTGAQACAYPLTDVAPTLTVPPATSALGCATTGADGTFVIPNLPLRANLVITMTKAGFLPDLLSIQTASSPMDVRQYPIFMFETASEVNPAPSITVDWQNKGQIVVFDVGLGDGGASVMMSSADDASPPAGQLLYQDMNDGFVPSATGFYPASGAVGASLGEFFNVPSGMYTLTAVDTADDCEPSLMPLAAWGFPLVTPTHSLQVLALDGYIAGLAGFICTPNSVIAPVDGG